MRAKNLSKKISNDFSIGLQLCRWKFGFQRLFTCITCMQLFTHCFKIIYTFYITWSDLFWNQRRWLLSFHCFFIVSLSSSLSPFWSPSYSSSITIIIMIMIMIVIIGIVIIITIFIIFNNTSSSSSSITIDGLPSYFSQNTFWEKTSGVQPYEINLK